MPFQDNDHSGCFNACGQSCRHYKNDEAYTITVLRHDLKKQSVKSNAPAKMELLSRFRLRIMFQNVTNYLILFVGILVYQHYALQWRLVCRRRSNITNPMFQI